MSVPAQVLEASGPQPEIDAATAQDAFGRVADKIRSVRQGDVVVASVDITKAAMVALATHHKLSPVRAQLADTVRNFRPEHLDLLPDLALAMWYCAQVERNQNDPAAFLADLLPRAVELKSTLLSQGRALAERKRVPLSVIEDYASGTGYEDLANDLSGLSSLFRERWTEIKGRCDIDEAELEEASTLGATILARLAVHRVLSGKDNKQAQPVEATPALSARDLRRRAFSLLYVAYEEVRRAASATFWYEAEGWESFAPSLWSYQGRGRTSAEEAEAPPKDIKPPAL